MSEPVVRAAGGLVARDDEAGQRIVAVVHRPRYDDWTFPKGKLQGGESDEETALREVLEETGLACALGRDLGSVEYRDREDRRKVVRYWVMTPNGGAFAPNEEVDELRWVTPAQAAALLTYGHDRDLLRAFLAGAGDAPVYLVRHAKAGSRTAWTEADQLRPLSKAGRRQADALVRAFRGLDVERVVASPFVRCVQTVRPLALDRGLPVETSDALSEAAPLEGALALVEELAATPAVLCTHGDVILAVLEHLDAGGLDLGRASEGRKGSVWILEREDGAFVRARYVEPSAG